MNGFPFPLFSDFGSLFDPHLRTSKQSTSGMYLKNSDGVIKRQKRISHKLYRIPKKTEKKTLSCLLGKITSRLNALVKLHPLFNTKPSAARMGFLFLGEIIVKPTAQQCSAHFLLSLLFCFRLAVHPAHQNRAIKTQAAVTPKTLTAYIMEKLKRNSVKQKNTARPPTPQCSVHFPFPSFLFSAYHQPHTSKQSN